MAKKRRSRFERWLDKQGEDSILVRILHSELMSEFLKEERPILYWFIVILLILISCCRRSSTRWYWHGMKLIYFRTGI